MASMKDVLPEQKLQGEPATTGKELTLFDSPTPGQSLTQDPNNKLPYETEPDFVTEQQGVQFLFEQFTSNEGIEEVLNFMRMKLPVEDIAQMALFELFRSGRITPDMMLLLLEPTIYMLVAIADYADVEVQIYPESEMETTKEEESELLKELLSKKDVEDVEAPESVTPDILTVLKNTYQKGEE